SGLSLTGPSAGVTSGGTAVDICKVAFRSTRGASAPKVRGRGDPFVNEYAPSGERHPNPALEPDMPDSGGSAGEENAWCERDPAHVPRPARRPAGRCRQARTH